MLVLFLTAVMVRIVALMSLGPDFLFVSRTAVNRSHEEVMVGMLGTTCGIVVRVGIALPGLHLVIGKMAWLYALIMVGGNLYPCWMGHQMLRDALKKEVVSAPALQVGLTKSGRNFLKGLLINLANSKAITYFGSVSSLFVGDNVGITKRWGAFALIIVETLARFTVVASLFALPQMRCDCQRLTKWIDGFAGALFAGSDIHLIISC